MRRTILALVLMGAAMPVTAQTMAPPVSPASGQMPPRMGGGGMMRADANRDGIVTREEALADAGARFDRMDTNHDGRLGRTELANLREARREMRGGPRGDTPPPPPQ